MQINNIYNGSGVKFSVTETKYIFLPIWTWLSDTNFLTLALLESTQHIFCPYWHKINGN